MAFNSGSTQLELFPPELAVRKVGVNCHIALDGVYYSVPHYLYGQMVIARINISTVDILDSNGKFVASHNRSSVKRKYITNPSHMPNFYYSVSRDDSYCYDGATLRKWAYDIGDKTYEVIDSMLSNKSIEEHAYRTCMCILQLTKKYGNSILEKACSSAVNSGAYNYTTIQKLAKIKHDEISNNS